MSTSIFRDFRSRHDLTQGQLGVALGIEPEKAQGRISHYESFRRDIPRDIAYRFLDFAKTKGEKFALEDVLPRPKESAA